MHALPRVTADRYVQPLREGGSLPAVVDTDDGLFVVKFRGAGQGPRALVAELIVGLLARELGLPVPELALVDIPPPFGRSEPDPEIQDILRKSHGINVGLRYLDGALNFDARPAGELADSTFASRVVWLDAFTTNPDRTHRNPNLLVWQRRLWLIDHGAALYAHHDWPAVDSRRTRQPFPLISQHVLLDRADALERADDHAVASLPEDVVRSIVAAIPDELLVAPDDAMGPAEARARYERYLLQRLESPRDFVAAAVAARAAPPALTAVPARR